MKYFVQITLVVLIALTPQRVLADNAFAVDSQAAEHKARIQYRRGYSPTPSPGKPVHLPAIKR